MKMQQLRAIIVLSGTGFLFSCAENRKFCLSLSTEQEGMPVANAKVLIQQPLRVVPVPDLASMQTSRDGLALFSLPAAFANRVVSVRFEWQGSKYVVPLVVPELGESMNSHKPVSDSQNSISVFVQIRRVDAASHEKR
jgi:hypothetical protein